MKKVAFFSSALFTSISLMGMMFKAMHWPGANIMFVIGVAGLAIVAVPTMSKFLFDKQ